MARKIKDGLRACRYCKSRKSPTEFHSTSIYTCLECLGDLSIDEFKENLRVKKNKQREVYRKEHKKKLLIKIGDAKEKRGYIYLLHSKSKGFYKIGVGIDPYKRLQDLRLTEYKIQDLKLLAFSVPVNDAFKTECFIHNRLKQYNVNFVKPCGGKAKELFKCSFDIISSLFVRCSQEINWKDKATLSKVNLRDKGTFKYIRPPKGEYKIRMKMHRAFRNYRRSIDANWNLFDSYNQKRLKCYGTGDREDHLYESVFDKKGKCISLGIFEDPEEAISVSQEFGEFLKSEKKSIRKKYRDFVYKIYEQWLDHRFYRTEFSLMANDFLSYIGWFSTKERGVFSHGEIFYKNLRDDPYYD